MLDSGHADIKDTFLVPKNLMILCGCVDGFRSVLGRVLR